MSVVYRVYRVYWLPEWREFGIEYPTRDAAERAANAYRARRLKRRYVVRRVRIRFTLCFLAGLALGLAIAYGLIVTP